MSADSAYIKAMSGYDEKSRKFDTFNQLPEALVPTSVQVMQFCGPHCPGTEPFNWETFKYAIDSYKGDDITFDKISHNTITRNTATVTVMFDKIVHFLTNAHSIVIAEEESAAIRAKIEATFLNLKTEHEKGWLDFSRSEKAGNSSWQYRLLFALPTPNLPNFFYSLVTTITLEADIQEEVMWWGLMSKSSHNFSAVIHAMQLVVQKGFKNPA